MKKPIPIYNIETGKIIGKAISGRHSSGESGIVAHLPGNTMEYATNKKLLDNLLKPHGATVIKPKIKKNPIGGISKKSILALKKYGIESAKKAYELSQQGEGARSIAQGFDVGIYTTQGVDSAIDAYEEYLKAGKPNIGILKNPIGKGMKEKIKAAKKRFTGFRKKSPGKVSKAKFKTDSVMFEIGKVEGILYRIPDGPRKGRYLHEFKKQAAPKLCASSDGKQIYIVGGDYRFTDHGIEDN